MWRIFFPLAAHLLFAAHCHYHGMPAVMAIPTALAVSLFVRHPLIPWLQLTALGVYAVDWGLTTWHLVLFRQAHGMPWVNATVIMTTVIVFTVVSAYPVFSKKLDGWFFND